MPIIQNRLSSKSCYKTFEDSLKCCLTDKLNEYPIKFVALFRFRLSQLGMINTCMAFDVDFARFDYLNRYGDYVDPI